AAAEIPVMILGETGTGKEEVAKTIHALSNRKNGPFIALNCSALNSNLAESELFGHEKGAFTGAYQTRKGRFELADKGTLFLDEVGDLPIELQPKLLRTLQDFTFERVGSEKTLKADVRIICATNVNLSDKIKEGIFREDLYYRLGVFPINLPPLRDRKEDLILICNRFIERLKVKYNSENLMLDQSAIIKLNTYNFTGNVRELSNIIERGAILANFGIIENRHILFEKFEDIASSKVENNNHIKDLGSLDEEISNIIINALKKCNGKIYGKDGAAALLKIKPTTLQSKMKKLSIKFS
ncbi:MAG TPA: sigma 54-interacting transcriptional regulator, partial [Melioribacteraceae bacterium]|nr:sigma 54-interacting transcriptional regulator [Melioribacteraceae bacterium]